MNPSNRDLHIYFDGIYPDADLWYRYPKIRFPSECLGFLYYHSPPGLGAVASSIRFRRISQRSVGAFARGQDLLLPNGLPWQIMASQVAVYDMYEGFRKKLIEENLWSDEDHTEIFRIFLNRRKLFPERTLFSLEQEFPLTLDESLILTMVGKDEQRECAMPVFGTDGKMNRWPFSGKYLPVRLSS